MLKAVAAAVAKTVIPDARLKKAKAARTEAQARLDEEKAAGRRVEDLIDHAAIADRTARKAYAAARQAVLEWATSGADPAGRAQFEKLEAEAAEADRLADRAETTAQAARAGFAAIEERVQDAERALRDRNLDVAEAAEAILLAEVEPQTAALERASAAYAAALAPVRALLRMTQSGTTYRRLQEVLMRTQPPALQPFELLSSDRRAYGDVLPVNVTELVEPLSARLRALREDPPPRWKVQLEAERESEAAGWARGAGRAD